MKLIFIYGIILSSLFARVIYAQEIDYVLKGNEEALIGNIEKAIQYYQIDIRKNPDSIAGRVGLAKCYSSRGYMSMVDNIVGQILARQGDNIDALLLLAKVKTENKEWSEVESIAKKVINIDKSNIKAHVHLRNALYQSGNPVDAESINKTLKKIMENK